MAMPPNRVMALCQQGKPAFGAYVRIPAPEVVEALAQAASTTSGWTITTTAGTRTPSGT